MIVVIYQARSHLHDCIVCKIYNLHALCCVVLCIRPIFG